jgi:uracil-DNA glycosylase
MGIDRATFYDDEKIAILPMGFCYPGTGKSGDLPPRPECATTWREKLLAQAPVIKLTLVIGLYAQKWHLGENQKENLTETVRAWREYWPLQVPLPHPSPRNNIWLAKNSWFEKLVVPALQGAVKRVLKD